MLAKHLKWSQCQLVVQNRSELCHIISVSLMQLISSDFPGSLEAEGKQTPLLLLMVQKSGVHQLRLVVYPIIYRVLAPSQVVSQISSINSTVDCPTFSQHSQHFSFASMEWPAECGFSNTVPPWDYRAAGVSKGQSNTSAESKSLVWAEQFC